MAGRPGSRLTVRLRHTLSASYLDIAGALELDRAVTSSVCANTLDRKELRKKNPGGKQITPNFLVTLSSVLPPRGFKKLREAYRIHFHLVAPDKFFMVPSCDQKNDNVHDYQIHED